MKPIYVHFESVSNHILSSEMAFLPEALPESACPKNLLLLTSKSHLAAYDDFTGFYYIKGRDKVKEFLAQSVMDASLMGNWIDFESLEFVHQLSPQEIADLLYISHAHTHLHSPFFYKLQNNFIFLSLPNGYTKVYYRNIDYFMSLLANRLTQEVSGLLTQWYRKWPWSPAIEAQALSPQVLKELVPYLREGLVFSLEKAGHQGGVISIPLHVTEDRLLVTNQLAGEKDYLGTLTYDKDKARWLLHLETESFQWISK